VERVGTGRICVTVAGIDSATASAVASVDWLGTSEPEGNASVMFMSLASAPNCAAPKFLFVTQRQPPIMVDKNNVANSATVAGPATAANDVGFQFVIP
jgi:hypothetical protein